MDVTFAVIFLIGGTILGGSWINEMFRRAFKDWGE